MSKPSKHPSAWHRTMAGRDPEESHRASTPLELLFDLTFVVAVALAAAELHHALAENHIWHGVAGYAMVFFGIWWAWMNFSWFASAYDTDDVLYRLLTLMQMAGVLVLAAGIPAAFEHFHFTTVVIGFVIMRVALVSQWLRAAREHRERRSATLRYAIGVSILQLGWIGFLWLPDSIVLIGFGVLAAAELAVPAWAEIRGGFTPWHPAHIAERYGLFTIITLGEVVLASTVAVQQAQSTRGLSAELLLTAAGGLALVFALWWSYFKHSATERIRLSRGTALFWGYGHYLVFASIAALGAGLQVVIDTLGHTAHTLPVFAAFTVAIPVAVFLTVLSVLNTRLDRRVPTDIHLVLTTAVLVLLSPLAARVISLPLTIIIMAALVTLLLTYHLAVASRRA